MRDKWILRMGEWLAAHGFQAPGLKGAAAAQALGSAAFALRLKGVVPDPVTFTVGKDEDLERAARLGLKLYVYEEHGRRLARLIWSAKPGSLAHRWAYTFSPVRYHPATPFREALRHELNAAAYVPPDALGVPTRQQGRGRPLKAGYDPLVVVRGLIDRGYEFPSGLLREGELELVVAFTDKSDSELQVELGVKPAALRKRRERLRGRMSQLVQIVKGGPLPETPTIVERLAWVEERVREHDRQLGLVSDDGAEQAVEALIADVAGEEAEKD